MQNEFEFIKNDSLAGFRLKRFEVLNWGTFDKKIWKIEPNSFNSLLTGDIGSGKSTLVDALTTLLVQQKRITYNKAAGAEGKERNLYQYIRGAHASLKLEDESKTETQYLRDKSSYSVILGVFYNSGFDKTETLAQVFWLREDKVEKFYLVANSDLKINEHFTNFGKEISELKKRLKKIDMVEVFETYQDYSGKFRANFGIKSDKALDLFYQTVSLKSINNLNDFIRENMLDKEFEKTNSEVEDLKQHFGDLNLAHEAILKAKKQIESLEPVINKSHEFEKLNSEKNEQLNLKQALPIFFAEKKVFIYQSDIENFSSQKIHLENKILEIEKELKSSREEKTKIENQISKLDEVREKERIENEMKVLETTIQSKKKLSIPFNHAAKFLEWKFFPNISEEEFNQNLEKSKKESLKSEEDLKNLEKEKLEFSILEKQNEEKIINTSVELDSLKNRKSLIPNTNLKMREFICSNLNLKEKEIPFVGELLKVKEAKWEGAIEKLLHNFALSILVNDDLYPSFVKFVNENNLKGRLVYFRISSFKKRVEQKNIQNPVYEKIKIKDDTEFFDFLESELKENFSHSCSETIEEFQKQQRAITKTGQIKSNLQKHEKDDRKDINDRSNFVLGWDNKEKILSLEKKLKDLEAEKKNLNEKINQIFRGIERIRERFKQYQIISEQLNYFELQWKDDSAKLENLKTKLEEFKNSSDKLKQFEEELKLIEEKIFNLDNTKSEKIEKRGSINQKLVSLNEQLSENQNYLGLIPEPEKEILFPKLKQQILIEFKTISEIDSESKKLGNQIESKIEKLSLGLDKIKDSLVRLMTSFKKDYPAETKDFDSSVESIFEFQKLFSKLKEEDLPKFEDEFRKKLNVEITRKIASFKEFLESQGTEIKERISFINLSLKEIEYNQGTYICLNLDPSKDVEIEKFKFSLKDCLTEKNSDEEFYTEERFQKVKLILDRLSSELEADRRWKEKVLDVTNWFQFSATERYFSDNSEKESYSGASGKSGGQKEKLAYTVLASALAYQFGLEWKETKSKTFRFVVIDEAFGRGSDESTRYGLELFKKLNLQLLIVTPLQKIHIIEEYINSCHFVTNEEGKKSSVKNLSIEEYRVEKDKFHLK